VVCRDGEVGGARGCGRVTGEDPGQRFTTAKTRSAGRGADFEAAAGKTVSAHTDSFERRKGSGAAVDSPSQAGANSGAGEERAAALAMNQGMTRKSRLWSQTGERSLRELLLLPWARRRREDLFRVRVLLDEQLAPPDRAVAEAAPKDQKARLLMTQPGLGPITSIPFVLTIGDVSRFQPGKQVASYLGADSAGVQFGREAAAGINQQAGELVYGNFAGRGGADGRALGSTDEK